jgi:hypothetical protein
MKRFGHSLQFYPKKQEEYLNPFSLFSHFTPPLPSK